MIVGFTENAHKTLMSAGASAFDLKRIAHAVVSMKKAGFDIDAFDEVSYKGIKLSFLRNHIDHYAIVMLLSEAMKLDEIVDEGIASGKYCITAN